MLFMSMEYELNRKWLYNKDGDLIGEQNFVVSMCDVNDFINNNYIATGEYENIDDFLNCYEPEVDGQKIYDFLKEKDLIIEEFFTKY